MEANLFSSDPVIRVDATEEFCFEWAGFSLNVIAKVCITFISDVIISGYFKTLHEVMDF